jgi:hypothetical protein
MGGLGNVRQMSAIAVYKRNESVRAEVFKLYNTNH